MNQYTHYQYIPVAPFDSWENEGLGKSSDLPSLRTPATSVKESRLSPLSHYAQGCYEAPRRKQVTNGMIEHWAKDRVASHRTRTAVVDVLGRKEPASLVKTETQMRTSCAPCRGRKAQPGGTNPRGGTIASYLGMSVEEAQLSISVCHTHRHLYPTQGQIPHPNQQRI